MTNGAATTTTTTTVLNSGASVKRSRHHGVTSACASASSTNTGRTGIWSQDEHDRFLEAMQKFPKGPWKAIAGHIQTRSVRQVQTHAQKYQEKVERRIRGLRKKKKRIMRTEHRLLENHVELCELMAEPEQVSPLPLSPNSPSVEDSSSSGDETSVKEEFDPLAFVTIPSASTPPPSHPLSPVGSPVDSSCDPWQWFGFAAKDKMTPLPSVGESLDFLIEVFSAPSTTHPPSAHLSHTLLGNPLECL